MQYMPSFHIAVCVERRC